MPIYEYGCRACGKEFERYVASSSTAVACPHCESAEVLRRLSVVGVKTTSALSSSAGSAGGCCGGGCGCH